MNDASEIEPTLEQKLDQAKRALAGPERTEKRERQAAEQVEQEERAKINERLTKIAKEKEKLELDWVSLDDKRRIINDSLKPILVQEKQTEEAEAKLEVEEARTAVPQEKQLVEKKRIEVQNQRQTWEKKKWQLQEELWQIEAAVEKNTKVYQTNLDEEDALQTKLEQLTNSGHAA